MQQSTLLRACGRQWLTTLLGLAMVAVAVGWATHRPEVYFSQTDVILLAPISKTNPNNVAVSSQSLVATASILQRKMDGGHNFARTSSPTIGLYDQGLYDDVRVRIPDTGGQWEHNFARPVLDVQVSGHNPDAVRQRMVSTQAVIRSILDQMQDDAGVVASQRIVVTTSPALPSVDPVSGSRPRAAAAALLLGLALTALLSSTVDRLRSGRVTRSDRAAGPPLPAESPPTVNAARV